MGDARCAAQALLGMEIISCIDRRTVRAMICETEAYYGFQDKASHASRGKTKRNAPMFEIGGTIYVYLVYGMHHCFNVVVGPKEYPAAVLIRGIVMLPEKKEIRGPGRVTKALGITSALSGTSIFRDRRIRFGKQIMKPKNIIKMPRVGVGYAKEWAHKPLRYLIQ